MSAFDIFWKSKDRIVCIDSDGCAVDTMNIKHIRCFGPCMVDEWDLGKWRNEILNRWNEINLFSMTRGINRFKGLALMLAEVDEKYCAIEGIDALKDWVDNAAELSNASLDKMIDKGSIFSKALKWSKSVNSLIEKLPKEEIKPFHGVREAFKMIHEFCDIAVVSSANPEAVRAEWERLGLLEYVDLICTQDMGSKSFCIGEILKKGYEPEHVLMCGDAPGDENAAAENGVLFFPILVNHENESWSELKDKAFSLFVSDSYSGAYQNELLRRFESNLGGIR
ncbi:hypothetical protein SAMN04487928_11711 [Butyrivibrio proteoclasticus]|uniref:Haloacid dehalogenase-like hydrolase n=1 Tax=Butyrivibrio proteoclasticus TaxID=43305 RepID=A0A1I5VFN5_9FIRM|nr:HAD hydrolase-like protein [Butyrivibrio proteoclasticus]SFQ06202.1 hypothetical protein SAMN04487928_11711 [Butyrivibrio proteoclasticus]